MFGKTILLTLLFFACIPGCSVDRTTVEPDETLVVNHTGVIQNAGTVDRKLFIIVDDTPDRTHYLPSNLPEEFKLVGQRVLFSGKLGVIPPNLRLVGTPLKLTSIEQDKM